MATADARPTPALSAIVGSGGTAPETQRVHDRLLRAARGPAGAW